MSKIQEQYCKRVETYLQEHGAEPDPTKFYDWQIETSVGKLLVQVRPNLASPGIAIFTRFDEPARALAEVDCNPYTGKWNFYYFEKMTPTIWADFQVALERLLPAGAAA